MRLQKTQNRKEKRIKKKLFLACGAGGIVILCLVGFILVHKYVLPSDLYLSPLSAVASENSARTKDTLRKLLSQKNIGYKSVVVTPDSTFLVTLSEKEEVLLTPDKDLTQQVASLQVILRQLTMEGKRFKRLDMRFDKPVISQ